MSSVEPNTRLFTVNAPLEQWRPSKVYRQVSKSYERKPADEFLDEPAKLTPRQASFCRNLISIACALESATIPVDFVLSDGSHVYLDRGCIKIAEHAGFILPIKNGPGGVVETVTLSWSVTVSS